MAENLAGSLTMKIIAIAVTIIIITTVALPVIQDVQDDQTDTAYNTDYMLAYTTGSASSLTMTISYTSSTVTVGSYTFDVPSVNVYPILVCDEYAICTDTGSPYSPCMIYAGGGYNRAGSDITITNGLMSFTTTDSTTYTVQAESTIIYAADSNIKFVSYGNDGSSFNVGKETFYAFGNPQLASGGSDWSMIALWKGSVTGGFSLQLGSDSYTGSSGALSTIPEFTDHHYQAINRFDLSYTVNDTTYSGTSVKLIPIVSYAYDVDGDDNALIGIIPIMLILVPVMMAVRMMVLRRN